MNVRYANRGLSDRNYGGVTTLFRPHYLNVERIVTERWNLDGFYDKKVQMYSLGRKWPVNRTITKRSKKENNRRIS